MNNNYEPVRELECKFDDNGHPSWRSFPLIKIAKSEVGVIYLHICLELLFLYMVLTRQENGFQLLRTKFVKA